MGRGRPRKEVADKKAARITKQEEVIALVEQAKKGDNNAFERLLKIVEPEIYNLQTKGNLWVFGFEDWDIYQECSFMLMKAIKNYNPERCKNFRFYAKILFKGRIVSLIQESKRHKNITLNLCTSLDDKVFQDEEGNDYSLYDLIPESDDLLSERIEKREYFEKLKAKIFKNLTTLEKNIFELYLEDFSYADIAGMSKISTKSVDNAIQRAKNKIPVILKEEIEAYRTVTKKTPKKRKYNKSSTKRRVGRPRKADLLAEKTEEANESITN